MGETGRGPRWHVEMAQEIHFAKEDENAMANELGDPPPSPPSVYTPQGLRTVMRISAEGCKWRLV